MNVPILYDDNYLLVVEKSVNLPVQETSSKDFDLFNLYTCQYSMLVTYLIIHKNEL